MWGRIRQLLSTPTATLELHCTAIIHPLKPVQLTIRRKCNLVINREAGRQVRIAYKMTIHISNEEEGA